jgi:hypothetical protein
MANDNSQGQKPPSSSNQAQTAASPAPVPVPVDPKALVQLPTMKFSEQYVGLKAIPSSGVKKDGS